MKRSAWLFPATSRSFTGQRWVNIALRTAHLLGVSGIGGGFLLGADPALWRPWLWLVIATGGAMVALQLWQNAVWLIQIRGIATLAKLLLLALMFRAEDVAPLLFVAIIIISAVVSHAPGSVRYHSPWHGRRLDALR